MTSSRSFDELEGWETDNYPIFQYSISILPTLIVMKLTCRLNRQQVTVQLALLEIKQKVKVSCG